MIAEELLGVKVAQLIVADSGDSDCIGALKDDLGQLYQEVKALFEDAEPVATAGYFHGTVNKGHGRVEHNRFWSIADQECLSYLNSQGKWPRMCSVATVTGEGVLGTRSPKRFHREV